MNRRSFIATILALGVAPAIVRADSLMRIVPRETLLLHGDMAFEAISLPVTDAVWLGGNHYGTLPILMNPEAALAVARRNMFFTYFERGQWVRYDVDQEAA